MARVINFSAGPATLPESVLRQAVEEMLDWHGRGQSDMEVSHRGKEFMSIAAQAEADLRELMAIPANYKVARTTARSMTSRSPPAAPRIPERSRCAWRTVRTTRKRNRRVAPSRWATATSIS